MGMVRRVNGSRHFRQKTGEEQRATWLELFFDLVFVFAVTQLSHLLLHHLTLHGALQTLFLLLVVWWAWIYTTWMTNWFDPESVLVRLVLLVVMASSLLMAVAIPEAFGRLAPLFACSYVLLQVVRNAFNVYATPRDNPFHVIFRRILAWSLVSGVLWLAGGFAPAGARTWLWIAALAVDYVAPSVGYWTPRLGRSATTDWEIEAAHFAERFQLFIIIALGESIVVTGATASSLVLDFANGTALMVAFATSAALWWLYFDEVGWRAQRFLSRADDSGRLARDAYTYLHIPIVAGHHRRRRRGRGRDRTSRRVPVGRGAGRDPGRAGAVPGRPHPVSAAHDPQRQPQTRGRRGRHPRPGAARRHALVPGAGRPACSRSWPCWPRPRRATGWPRLRLAWR